MANGTIAFDTLQTSDSVNTGTSKTLDTSYLYNGSAKAWANYTTASTFVNNDSFNIGSLTDDGAGSCTLNFTNAMTNASFSSPALSNETNTIQAGTTSSSVSIISKNDSPSSADAARNHTTTHGDLA